MGPEILFLIGGFPFLPGPLEQGSSVYTLILIKLMLGCVGTGWVLLLTPKKTDHDIRIIKIVKVFLRNSDNNNFDAQGKLVW